MSKNTLFGDNSYRKVKEAKKALENANIEYVFIHEEDEDRPRLLTKEGPKSFRGLEAIQSYARGLLKNK